MGVKGITVQIQLIRYNQEVRLINSDQGVEPTKSDQRIKLIILNQGMGLNISIQ